MTLSKNIVFLFPLAFVFSCASIGNAPIKPIEPKIKFSSIDIEVQNGKAKFVEFTTPQDDGRYFLECVEQNTDKPFKQRVPYFVTDNKAQTYYAESYFSIAKSHQCFYEDQLILNIKVSQFPYKQEKLNVAKGKVELSKKDLLRVRKEREITKKIYENSAPRLLFGESFKVPLNSFITSHYGNQRLFNNKKRSQHLGNDFRARVGVKIPTSNKGKVVYVGNLFYAGNVVIIDHGLNIFSLYGHLSKILVTEGTIVNKGDIVGLSGRTGRVSGPHLHWGIKINGHNIDGFSLVNESLKQFEVNEPAQ